MKQIKMISMLLALLLLLSGCQLARPDGETAKSEDRLIGVLVTRDYLDLLDFEAYFQDHTSKILKGGEQEITDTKPYEGRLYAVMTTETRTNEDGETVTLQNYEFEGVEGSAYFVYSVLEEDGPGYTATESGEEISDGHTNLFYSDQEEAVELEATIYYAPRTGEDVIDFYFNPVYQTADGQVYAMSGNSTSTNVDGAGVSFCHTLSEESTQTENGVSKTWRSSVKVTVESVDPPERITVLQMGEDHGILTETSYEPGTLPENLELLSETAYLIVETLTGGTIKRELVNRDAETMTTFRCREDGICVKQTTTLTWVS